jgi:predicted extracellular nuclease
VLELAGGAPALLGAEAPAWAPAPPAPERAAPERLRVVALNLDNYFVTLGGRGARSAAELERQRDKLVALLLALDADILALTELENAGARALEHLLEGLDARLEPALAYRFAESTPPAGSPLRAALAYRATRVRARGDAWFDARPGYQRAPLFQAFERDGARFVLGVVHFKSKRCGDEPTLVPAGGCGDDTRVAEAELLIQTARDVSARDDGWLLVLGDYNADSLEAPLTTLERAGFRDLLDTLQDADRYSYVYAGRASLLDHALAAPGRRTPPAEVAIWHINADEPAFRGYALDASALAGAARSSDHDPLIVDLQP